MLRMRGARMLNIVLGVLFFVLILATLFGWQRAPRGWLTDPKVASEVFATELSGTQVTDRPRTLFLVVHGFGGSKQWKDLIGPLGQKGTVIGLHYDPYSSACPLQVSELFSAEVARHYDAARYDRVVLIGISMGAPLARRTFLDAWKKKTAWAAAVDRIVLVAGMNRGWTVTHHRPKDMGWLVYAQLYVGTWLARLTDVGALAMAMEAGSPFVANLRLDWMRALREEGLQSLVVVQLLGDIDDFVSDQDNKDLAALGSARFVWLRVRGTGHSDTWNFSDKHEEAGITLGAYRKKKFMDAVTADFELLDKASEKDPVATDEDTTHLVFVIHGIRDLGQWAAAFERSLNEEFAPLKKQGKKLQIASLRYGYFGMGPFLLLSKRQNHVRWLMDQYTELLARYPKVEQIHFVGHSNGTYLLASALEHYQSLRLDRVVFGGSVVRQDFDWGRILRDKQVKEVRNYVAADDNIVAWFPRFFELPISFFFYNDLGSAGFNGFEPEVSGLRNIRYLKGGHGAILKKRTAEIAHYLVHGRGEPAAPDTSKQQTFAKAGSSGVTVALWAVLGWLIIWVGWNVVMSAPEPRWPMLFAYVGLLLALLLGA